MTFKRYILCPNAHAWIALVKTRLLKQYIPEAWEDPLPLSIPT